MEESREYDNVLKNLTFARNFKSNCQLTFLLQFSGKLIRIKNLFSVINLFDEWINDCFSIKNVFLQFYNFSFFTKFQVGFFGTRCGGSD